MAKQFPIKRVGGFLGACALFLLVVPSGCDSGTARVTGTVRFKGMLLTSGSVKFIGVDGQSKSTAIAENGAYQIDNPPLGTVTITVKTHPRVPKGLTNTREDGSKDQHEGVPDKYGIPDQSGLTFTVRKGSQTYNIDLDP